MNTDMLETGEGFQRIMTIVARGYLWKGRDADLDHARRALCAWCNIPDTEKAGPKAGWENKTGYAELHGEFPELVGEEGWGWLIRHVHSVCTFARTNPALVQKTRLEHCLEPEKTFEKSGGIVFFITKPRFLLRPRQQFGAQSEICCTFSGSCICTRRGSLAPVMSLLWE